MDEPKRQATSTSAESSLNATTPREEKENRLRYNPYRRLEPLLCVPERLQTGQAHGHWLKEGEEMSEWLILFYDVVVVAILTVFSERHELRSASAIGNYFSYFVILWYTWFSQTLYDVRYAGNDMWHRVGKLCELCSFVYLGAASGGWNPTLIQPRSNADIRDAVQRDDAASSFYIVGTSYAVMRGILITQYLMAFALARHTRRPTRAIVLPTIGLFTSLAMIIISVVLSPTSTGLVAAKLTLFYSSMLVELAFEAVAASHQTYIRVPAARLYERLGAFSLIILGEGFISVLRADSVAIQGFNVSDTNVYVLVFCTIAIIFYLFISLFQKNPDYMGKKRGMLWAGLHFPLHFTILLLLSALVNNIVFRAYVDGTSSITDQLVSYIIEIEEQGQWPPPGYDQYQTTVRLNKLDLDPPWSEEYDKIGTALAQGGNPGPELLVYFGQVIYRAAQTYDIEVPDQAAEIYNEISQTNVNQSDFNNNTVLLETIQRLGQQLYDMESLIADPLIKGTLWLLPTAGGAFVLLAILNIIRNDHRTIHSYNFPVAEVIQFSAGASLALLGMLAIGKNSFSFTFTENATVIQNSQSPFLTLSGHNLAIPLVLLVYALSFNLTLAILYRMRRRQQKSRLPEKT